jgi:hypothetical protein
MQVKFGNLIEKGNNCTQVFLSYPYDQILSRDRKKRYKGRDLGSSCLMRFLPKIGLIKFTKDHLIDPENEMNVANLKKSFKIGNLGDVIKPKVFDEPKYKMKKIVSHEELLENLEIIVQDKVFNLSHKKCLIFLGTSKETFFNIFKAFCGYQHERIFTKLDDADIEREKESKIRRKRRAREKKLKNLKTKGLISENDYEEELRKIYLKSDEMRQELEKELMSKNRDFSSKYLPRPKDEENLLIIFDCFSNLSDYYNEVNISGESINRKILEYIQTNELANTKVLILGTHSNKISETERKFYKKINKVFED